MCNSNIGIWCGTLIEISDGNKNISYSDSEKYETELVKLKGKMESLKNEKIEITSFREKYGIDNDLETVRTKLHQTLKLRLKSCL